VTPEQRFVRFATDAIVRLPWLWRLFRRPLTRNFDRLAPEWDATRVDPLRQRAMVAALDALPGEPRRVLDLGTGTGSIARVAAGRWPGAEVVGVDASAAMVAEARRLTGSARERYEVADASGLPFEDGSFDLVTLNNMIPFFDELARVTAPGGYVAIAYSMGSRTPIWVPLERVRDELQRRGFLHIADFEAGTGVALLARRS
jgi:ubiquinone/menaquinone biosynthesis C-methylase UbiE